MTRSEIKGMAMATVAGAIGSVVAAVVVGRYMAAPSTPTKVVGGELSERARADETRASEPRNARWRAM